MGMYIDGVIEALQKSVNVKLWLYFLLVSIISGIVFGIVALIFFLISIPIVSTVLGIDIFAMIAELIASSGTSTALPLFTQLMTSLADPAIFTNLIIVAVVLFVIFVIITMLIEAFFTAVFFNLARDFLNKGLLDLGDAFSRAKERFFTLFKVNILVQLFICILALIVFLPVLFGFLNLIQTLPSAFLSSGAAMDSTAVIAPLLGLVILFAGLVLVFSLITLFLQPYLNLFTQVVVFEKLGTIDSIKRTIEIVKGKYFSILGFILFFAVLVLAIGMAFGLIVGVIQAMGLFAPILLVIAIGIRVILQIIFGIWVSAWSAVTYVKLYDIVSGTAKKPEKSFVGVRAV